MTEKNLTSLAERQQRFVLDITEGWSGKDKPQHLWTAEEYRELERRTNLWLARRFFRYWKEDKLGTALAIAKACNESGLYIPEESQKRMVDAFEARMSQAPVGIDVVSDRELADILEKAEIRRGDGLERRG